MMKILFKYATKSRPAWFKKTLETYQSMFSGKHFCFFVVSMNEDDPTMNNLDMRTYLLEKTNVAFNYGNYRGKIEAINADMEGALFDILVVVSDDMIPVVKGFDDIIVTDMKKYFPNLDGALHYPDGIQRDNLITCSIMGRKLYEYFGYIYNPEYMSLWCDTEFTHVVKQLNKVKFIDRTIIRHEWRKHNDALYTHNNDLFQRDKQIFDTRRAQGFPLKQKEQANVG